MRWLSRAVTVIVITTVVVGAVFLLRSRMPAQQVGQKFTTWALFRDGSRLAVGSPVVIAGVRIGEIETLTIDGGFARVDMRLLDDPYIPVDSWITKRAVSAFGDNYIEIIPTGGEAGAPTARMLRSGEQLTHVIEGSSTDAVLRAIGRAMPKVDNALDSVHDFMVGGRRWVNGTFADGVNGADRWVAEGHIEKPLEAADRAMQRFEDGTTRAADAVAGAKPTVDKTLTRVEDGVASARKQMANVKSGITNALHDTREGLDRVDEPIENMRQVVVAINEGKGQDWKGTLGRLVNEKELASTIDDAAEAGRDFSEELVRLKSWLGLRIEFDVFARLPRFYVAAEIRARNDKFWLIELEKSYLGANPGDNLTDVPGGPTYTRTQEIEDSLRFTFQFGKQLGPLSLRGGIKESTFGVGADFLTMNSRLKFSADLFGSFTYTPNLKVGAAFQVFRSLYVLAGVNNMLNKPGYLQITAGNTDVPTQFQPNSVRFGRDYYFGTVLQFTDADLATLLRVYGALIVSALL